MPANHIVYMSRAMATIIAAATFVTIAALLMI